MSRSMVFGVLALGLVAGCNVKSPAPGAMNDVDMGEIETPEPTDDGGITPTDDAATTPTPTPANAPLGPKRGQIAFVQSPGNLTVTASFLDVAGEVPATCTTETIGSCVATNCTTAAVAGTQTRVSAGALAITGIPTVMTVALEPQQNNAYRPVGANRLFLVGGEELSVAAAGVAAAQGGAAGATQPLGVPKFDAKIAAASQLKIVAPVAMNGGIQIDPTKDVELQWAAVDPAKQTQLFGDFVFTATAGTNSTLTCTYPVSALKGTITVAAFAKLANGNRRAQFSSVTTKRVKAGDYDIELRSQFVPQ